MVWLEFRVAWLCKRIWLVGTLGVFALMSRALGKCSYGRFVFEWMSEDGGDGGGNCVGIWICWSMLGYLELGAGMDKWGSRE